MNLHTSVMRGGGTASVMEKLGERNDAGAEATATIRFVDAPELVVGYAVSEATRVTQLETKHGVQRKEVCAILVDAADLDGRTPLPGNASVTLSGDNRTWALSDDLDSEYSTLFAVLRLVRTPLVRQSSLIAPDQT